MTRRFLALALVMWLVAACDPASSLPIRLEEPERPGETVQVDRIDVGEAYRIIDEVLTLNSYRRVEDYVDSGSGVTVRVYYSSDREGMRGTSCYVEPVERGLEIRLFEFGRWSPSSKARELAEALRVVLGARFGEDCVRW